MSGRLSSPIWLKTATLTPCLEPKYSLQPPRQKPHSHKHAQHQRECDTADYVYMLLEFAAYRLPQTESCLYKVISAASVHAKYMQTATSSRNSDDTTLAVWWHVFFFCSVVFRLFWHMATTGVHLMEFPPSTATQWRVANGWNFNLGWTLPLRKYPLTVHALWGTNVHEGWTSFSNDKKIFAEQIFFYHHQTKTCLLYIERIILYYWCMTHLMLCIPPLFGWDNVHTELITRWLRLLWSESPINECVQSWTVHSLSTALQRVMSCLWEEDYFTWQAVLGTVASAFAPSHRRCVPVIQWMWSSG